MSVEVTGQGLKIKGNIDFDNTPKLLSEIKPHLDNWSTIKLDLESVESVNSSAIALFLELVRIVNSKNKSVEFINTPDQLLRLIKVSNLEGILRAH